MLKITEIKKEDMLSSAWSGGTTTQIFIYPKDAVYSERDFLFRISTATVELEESDFTSLPDYERIIASVEGRLLLTHDGGEGIEILPRSSVHRFDGGARTHSVGRVSDLNLMLKKGCASGELRFLKRGERAVVEMNEGEFALCYDMESKSARLAEADENDFLVFMAEGESALFTVKLFKERYGEE